MNEEESVLEQEEIPEQEELLEEELSSEPEEGEPEGDPEVVEKAKKYGHLSKEEWVAQGRDPAKYKTPEEFNKTGEVIEQIFTLKKTIEKRDREIEAILAYQQRTSEREYERAKQDLEARLNASKNDLDMEGVAHYTQELTRLQYNEQQNKAYNQERAKQEAQQAFIERNQHWFNDRNPDLKQRAIEIDAEIKDLYPNATFEELAKKIETRMQYDYPDRVIGPTRNVRPAVSPGTSSINKTAVNTNSAKKTFQSLPQELKDAYSAHARIRASLGEELTHAEFIERLKKDGEI